MALKRRKILKQALDLGHGTSNVPADSGGYIVGDKIGIHTLLPDCLNVRDFGAVANGSSDDAEAFSDAYDALPSHGGSIYVPPGNYVLGAALSFGTDGKRPALIGTPGSATILNYTPTTGTALTFDVGNDTTQSLPMGYGISGISLVGPGHGNACKGLVFGGSNGAHGFLAEKFRISGFGTGAEMGSHTWCTLFHHGIIRDCATLLMLPSGLTEAGEQITFDHVTFADRVDGSSNAAVWVKGNSMEAIFSNCPFDDADLGIGVSTTHNAQVVVNGCRFENPSGGTNYDCITVAQNAGNLLRMTNTYFLQTKSSSAPARFCYIGAGSHYFAGIGMYTAGTMANFAVLETAACLDIGSPIRDLSGNISGATFSGGQVTGFTRP